MSLSSIQRVLRLLGFEQEAEAVDPLAAFAVTSSQGGSATTLRIIRGTVELARDPSIDAQTRGALCYTASFHARPHCPEAAERLLEWAMQLWPTPAAERELRDVRRQLRPRRPRRRVRSVPDQSSPVASSSAPLHPAPMPVVVITEGVDTTRPLPPLESTELKLRRLKSELASTLEALRRAGEQAREIR